MLLRDGGFAVLQRGIGVADPVLAICGKRAARIGLEKTLEAGNGGLIVADLEKVKSRFVSVIFRTGIGTLVGSGGGVWRGCGRRTGGGAIDPLQFAQPVIKIDIQIFLTLLCGFDVVGIHLDLAAQFSDVVLHGLHALEQIDQALGMQRRIELSHAVFHRGQLLLQLLVLLLQCDDLFLRLIIREQTCPRHLACEEQPYGQPCALIHYSPWYTMSVRRFCDQQDSS